jgi:uncharacterized protein YkwD
MITKMILCASVLMFGDVQASEQNPQPKSAQPATQKAPQKAKQDQKTEQGQKAVQAQKAVQTQKPAQDQKAKQDQKAEQGRGELEVAAKKNPSQPVGKNDKTKAPSEPEEKVVDGIRLATIEANIVSYTNEERVRYGLPEFKVDKELMQTSREHAAWMTRNRSMVHTWRPVAENIAMGQPHSSDAVRAWMNSSGHRANILNSGHRRIGVAAFRTDEGTIFWCQQFQD